MNSSYPEHEKVAEVHERSQAIGEFIEWLGYEKDIRLCQLGHGDRFWPASESIERLLAEHFDIDLEALSQEKDRMVEEARRASRMRGGQ